MKKNQEARSKDCDLQNEFEMTESQANDINWREGFSDSTADPKVSMSLSDEVPTLAATSILGVTFVVVLAIVFVFVLGIMIDCRQQRLMDIKNKPIRRFKLKKPSSNSEVDGISITNNMEGPDMSLPPLETIRHVP